MSKPKRMTSKEFQGAMDALDTSFGDLANTLGVNSRTARRWADDPMSPDFREVPHPVGGIIRLMVAGLITPRQMWQAVNGQPIDRGHQTRKSSK